MQNTTNHHSADGSDIDIDSLPGEDNVDTYDTGDNDESYDNDSSEADEVLKTLSEEFGREFKSLDEFKKHYKHLNSFVGDKKIAEIRQKAKAFDEFQKRNNPQKQSDDMLTRMEERFDRRDFLDEFPEAKGVWDVVKVYAKANNMSYSEAYKQQFKDFVDAKIARDKEKDQHVKSNNRIAPAGSKKVRELAQRIQKGVATDAEREAFVAESLGL